jgi:IS30 family transposase
VRADGAAWKASTRPKVPKLAAHPELAEVVAERLKKRWSPQQIAGWLRRVHPDEPSAVGVARDVSTGRGSYRPKVP